MNQHAIQRPNRSPVACTGNIRTRARHSHSATQFALAFAAVLGACAADTARPAESPEPSGDAASMGDPTASVDAVPAVERPAATPIGEGCDATNWRAFAPDLQGCDLRGVAFVPGELDGIRAHDLPACPRALPFGWACVEQVELGTHALVGPGALLAGADLSGAVVEGANLIGADLAGANVTGTSMASSSLISANLRGADARSSDLRGTDLRAADLTHALLDGADLGAANLSAAHLAGISARALTGCPGVLPDAWTCVPTVEGLYELRGPGVENAGRPAAGALH